MAPSIPQGSDMLPGGVPEQPCLPWRHRAVRRTRAIHTQGVHMTRDDDVATVAKLIKDAKIAMLTTVDSSGALVSRPMGVQDVEYDGDLWFFADAESHKVHEIEAGSPA